MRLTEIIEQPHDDEHWAAHERTGFFGAQGAGCLFFAQDTAQFLLGRRSAIVEQPGTWGTFGGAVNGSEDVRVAALREAREETGFSGPHRLHPLFVFSQGSFRYSNFLLEVERAFHPRLNWENTAAHWFEFGNWPQPLHFGMLALLSDATSVTVLRSFADR